MVGLAVVGACVVGLAVVSTCVVGLAVIGRFEHQVGSSGARSSQRRGRSQVFKFSFKVSQVPFRRFSRAQRECKHFLVLLYCVPAPAPRRRHGACAPLYTSLVHRACGIRRRRHHHHSVMRHSSGASTCQEPSALSWVTTQARSGVLTGCTIYNCMSLASWRQQLGGRFEV